MGFALPRCDRRGLPAPGPIRGQIADEVEHAARRFLEFFTANIWNRNTRAAFAQAVAQVLTWCEERRLSLKTIDPMAVAAYIESAGIAKDEKSPSSAQPSVRQAHSQTVP